MVHSIRLINGVTRTSVEMEPESSCSFTCCARRYQGQCPRQSTRSSQTRAHKFPKLVESENLTLIKAMVGLSPADAASALNIDATEDVFDHMALMDDTEIAFDAARAVDVVAQSAFCAAFVRWASRRL